MVKKFIKFIEKHPQKELFLKILKDISNNFLDSYDIKPLAGRKGTYRMRAGTIRIIFAKTPEGNKILEINNRGDMYKRGT